MIVATAALALVPASVAAAQEVVLSTEPSAPKIAADGGAVAWSSYDAAARSWVLRIWREGRTESANVGPRSVPFDVDLGTDRGGRLVATYSRCRVENASFPTRSRGCDIYVYDILSGIERGGAPVTTRGGSEFLPTMAAGRIAFARVYDAKRTHLGSRPVIYVRDLRHRGPSRRLPAGTWNGDRRTGPVSLDLDSKRLAIAWDVLGPNRLGPYGADQMLLDRLSGSQTVVEQHGHGNLSAIVPVSPSLSGGFLDYGRTYVGDGDAPSRHRYVRLNPATGARATAQAPYRLAGTATDGGRVVVVWCHPEPDLPTDPSGCVVVLRGPVEYVG